MAYNGMNPAVRRIFREIAEIREDLRKNSATPGGCFCAVEAVNDNLFELHFTIRGPPDTPFELGCYHGKLILPHNYPFKPPEITFLTPSGRFEVKKKICLSISDYHPESWQPAWGLRTVLIGISSFMAAESAGAIGSLSWSAEERTRLATESLNWTCPDCNRRNCEILPGAGRKYVASTQDEQTKSASSLCFAYSKSASSLSSDTAAPEPPNESGAPTEDGAAAAAPSPTSTAPPEAAAAAVETTAATATATATAPAAAAAAASTAAISEAERLRLTEEIRRRTQETRTLRSRVDFLILVLIVAVIFKLYS